MPENKKERLEDLKNHQILDTAPEVCFDDITTLAAQILGCPVFFIEFMDEDRQWLRLYVQ